MEVWQGNLASCNYYAIKPGFSISYHCKFPVKLRALATQVLNQEDVFAICHVPAFQALHLAFVLSKLCALIKREGTIKLHIKLATFY
ncbi:hypothetical protein CMV_008724 [Castanea mollissima]|uniref:Uncharacterized protein n=1 Tax=Castanea mollissima TaxID=60419 RepID=A0A8J4VP10_9ROSI|nr:hypothetical protein CMV_008724 [Castanea mollissima]